MAGCSQKKKDKERTFYDRMKLQDSHGSGSKRIIQHDAVVKKEK